MGTCHTNVSWERVMGTCHSSVSWERDTCLKVLNKGVLREMYNVLHSRKLLTSGTCTMSDSKSGKVRLYSWFKVQQLWSDMRRRGLESPK